jgi:hypothetical protein
MSSLDDLIYVLTGQVARVNHFRALALGSGHTPAAQRVTLVPIT